MKILFVTRELKMEPLGIVYLASALKRAGHEIKLVRTDHGMTPRAAIVEYGPQIVAYSVCSGSEQAYMALDKELIRFAAVNKLPPFRSVFGGPAVTFTPEKFAGRHAIRGEGEEAMVAWVNGTVFKPLQLVPINQPTPRREWLYADHEDLAQAPIKNIITSRGCPHRCGYCFNARWNDLHKGQAPWVRRRSVDSVVAEAQYLKANWPLKMVNFPDDNLADLAWLEELAEKWPATQLPFFCSVRPDDVTATHIALLAKAGCAIVNMAVESAVPETRRCVLNRFSKNAKVVETIQLCKRFGLRTRLQNIIGLPIADPLKDALTTLRFNADVQPTISWCSLLQAYRGTKIHDIAVAGGYIDADHDDTDQEFFNHSTLRILDKTRIERLHKIWHLAVRYRTVRWLLPIILRLPLPWSWWRGIFAKTKRWITERDLWKVF